MRKLHVLLAATSSVAAITIAGPAFAAGPQSFKAVTHTSDHPDTTDAPANCPTAPQFDPTLGTVWATDDLSLQLVATPVDATTYSVKVSGHGSFDAFADPRTGDCWTGHGSVNGWIVYTVTSQSAPNKDNVPSQEPSDMTQREIVAQYFGVDPSAVSGGNDYSYAYNRVNGSRYTQP